MRSSSSTSAVCSSNRDTLCDSTCKASLGACNSACPGYAAAGGSTQCNSKNPGVLTSCNQFGSANRLDKCSDMCTISDDVCSQSCGGSTDTYCNGRKPGDTCISGGANGICTDPSYVAGDCLCNVALQISGGPCSTPSNCYSYYTAGSTCYYSPTCLAATGTCSFSTCSLSNTCSGTNRCGDGSGDTQYFSGSCGSGGCSFSSSNCACDASDSDGGQVFTTLGTCVDYIGCSGSSCQSSTYTDSCVDAATLREYYVSSSGDSATCGYVDKKCSDLGAGYTCSGGVCSGGGTTTTTTIPTGPDYCYLPTTTTTLPPTSDCKVGTGYTFTTTGEFTASGSNGGVPSFRTGYYTFYETPHNYAATTSCPQSPTFSCPAGTFIAFHIRDQRTGGTFYAFSPLGTNYYPSLYTGLSSIYYSNYGDYYFYTYQEYPAGQGHSGFPQSSASFKFDAKGSTGWGIDVQGITCYAPNNVCRYGRGYTFTSPDTYYADASTGVSSISRSGEYTFFETPHPAPPYSNTAVCPLESYTYACPPGEYMKIYARADIVSGSNNMFRVFDDTGYDCCDTNTLNAHILYKINWANPNYVWYDLGANTYYARGDKAKFSWYPGDYVTTNWGVDVKAIQCYVPTQCTGSITLNAEPTRVLTYQWVYYSASGLSNCGGPVTRGEAYSGQPRTIRFYQGGCTGGTLLGQCTGDTGCTPPAYEGNSWNSDTSGAYSLSATIDMNCDGDVTDPGECDTKTVSVYKCFAGQGATFTTYGTQTPNAQTGLPSIERPGQYTYYESPHYYPHTLTCEMGGLYSCPSNTQQMIVSFKWGAPPQTSAGIYFYNSAGSQIGYLPGAGATVNSYDYTLNANAVKMQWQCADPECASQEVTVGYYGIDVLSITCVAPPTYQLTMAASPSGSGTTSPAVGTYSYNQGTSVPISASAGSGYTFSSWSGSGTGSYTGTTNSVSITMNGPITQTANFVVSACPGTDASCGTYPSCTNCNDQDGWWNYGDLGPGCAQLNDPTAENRNYYCSANSCVYPAPPTNDCDSQDGWYGGGNTVPAGCGIDPPSQQKDYYVVSSGSCTYTTTSCGATNCDSQDVCSNICQSNTIYSYKDYYVVANSNTCTSALGSSVEACGTKASTDTDSGDAPLTKGTVTDYTGCTDGASSCSFATHTDSCAGNTLTEYYVSGSSYLSKAYDCTSYGAKYICSNGRCTQINCNSNADCDDSKPCTTDTCVNPGTESSYCTYANKAEGTACPDDGNICKDDFCSSGDCIHPNKPENTDCGNCRICTSGSCVDKTKPSCTECKSGPYCNGGTDTWYCNNNGLCTSCTGGYCDGSGGCVANPCGTCKYCSGSNCVNRADGTDPSSDCGAGCQKCVSGVCADYNPACSGTVGSCNCFNDACKACSASGCCDATCSAYSCGSNSNNAKCSGGTPFCNPSCSCVSCTLNTDCPADGWYDTGSWSCNGVCQRCKPQEYRDYSCSAGSCTYPAPTTRNYCENAPNGQHCSAADGSFTTSGYCGSSSQYCDAERYVKINRFECDGSNSCTAPDFTDQTQDCGATYSDCKNTCTKTYHYTCSAGSCGTYSRDDNCPQGTACLSATCAVSNPCSTGSYECQATCTRGQKQNQCDGSGNCNVYWQWINLASCNSGFSCSAGSCGSTCSASCGADSACDGKTASSSCGTGKTCDSSCKCVVTACSGYSNSATCNADTNCAWCSGDNICHGKSTVVCQPPSCSADTKSKCSSTCTWQDSGSTDSSCYCSGGSFVACSGKTPKCNNYRCGCWQDTDCKDYEMCPTSTSKVICTSTYTVTPNVCLDFRYPYLDNTCCYYDYCDQSLSPGCATNPDYCYNADATTCGEASKMRYEVFSC